MPPPPEKVAYFRRLITVASAAVLVASTLAFSSPAVAQTQPFTDTSSDSYYSDAVAALADNGIFDGTECAEGMLCPEASIDRKTMAVWTVRALDGQDPTQTSGDRFTDVDANSFHAPFIERMAELGVTSGCGDGSAFCPHDTVNRAQMAVFLTRGFNLDPGPDPGFSDVAADAWYYDHAAALAASGITAGCGDGTTFCPRRDTSRAQMATFLARALGLLDTPAPPTSGYTDVTVSQDYACALRTDGTVDCWGELSEFTTDRSSSELSQQSEIGTPDGSYEGISALEWHLLALRPDGGLEYWLYKSERIDVQEREFDSESGALVRPQIFRGSGQFVIQDGAPEGIFSSVDHRCGIRTDDTIACWGSPDQLVSGLPEGTFTSINVSNSNACAIRTDGTIACWGSPHHVDADELVSGLPEGTFRSVSVGNGYACAIGSDRSIACWGDPRWGRDGRGYPDGEPTTAPPGTFEAVTVGLGHACAIRTDGTVACWGADAHGWLDAPHGTFTAIDTWPPFWRYGDSAGGYTAAVSSDGRVAFWGSIKEWECCG